MSDEDKKTEETTEEKQEEAPVKEPKEEVEVPDKFKALIEQIESMRVLELHELVKVLEKKFDVSAAVTVASTGAGAENDGEEEQNEFTVELIDPGTQKIQVIKAIKGILGLGLKEAKDMVDGVPSVLKEGVKKEDAEEMKKKIEEVGGKVELK